MSVRLIYDRRTFPTTKKWAGTGCGDTVQRILPWENTHLIFVGVESQFFPRIGGNSLSQCRDCGYEKLAEISGFGYYLDWRYLVVYLTHFEVISLLLRLG